MPRDYVNEGDQYCPDFRYPTADGGKPVPLDEVFRGEPTRTPWVNRDTQSAKAPATPPPQGDRPIPVYLRVGKNMLSAENFEIAARKFFPKQQPRLLKQGEKTVLTQLEKALETGRFVFQGVECVRLGDDQASANTEAA